MKIKSCEMLTSNASKNLITEITRSPQAVKSISLISKMATYINELNVKMIENRVEFHTRICTQKQKFDTKKKTMLYFLQREITTQIFYKT